MMKTIGKDKKNSILIVVALFLCGHIFGQSTSDMLESVLPSVVTVAVFKTEAGKQTLGFRGEQIAEQAYEKALDMAGAEGSGSGFIIMRNGKKYVITNAHVIESASDEPGSIYAYTINRKKYELKIVGGDSFYDIAVLEFVDTPGDEITTVDFKTEESRIGETVYAIGNPLGEYPYSVSDGIISAKNRVRGGTTGKFGFLQTTATVIWGNSGGPLVDAKGKVAGINSQIAFAENASGEDVWQSQINFALEAGLANRLVNEIINNNGRVLRAFIGIEVVQRFEYVSTFLGDYLETIDSLPVILNVIPGSPGYSALKDKIGYVLTEINGIEVRNVEEALGEFEKIKPGQTANLTCSKDGAIKKVSVKTITLKEEQLEMIAKHVLDNNKDIEPDYNSQYVTFSTQSKEKFYGPSDGKMMKMKPMEKTSERFVVLACGVAGEEYQNMWRVDDLKSFGAAVKLSGPLGVIDFYGMPTGGSEDDVELFRQYISGDENIIQSTIYY
ncbi:MAG: trypsin-like peptidase domain-containing protein [Bacteroidales bacterium]|nr:trypsin-like peptidase domain-containing protein [Bacteroidales bacterium]